ncbi:UNKNOWN [Stylonychia lemnae]|uniref:Uncharacterized protein n=1 Tax=Stylonychia lemnae TaxID=5949 RepID=A0A077ZZ27_STYLE|nr:UNKNOWN [Stylonychia lemnae]|eukprot:CDW75175.1 UNKNOWN [Stylonychia lemnae]
MATLYIYVAVACFKKITKIYVEEISFYTDGRNQVLWIWLMSFRDFSCVTRYVVSRIEAIWNICNETNLQQILSDIAVIDHYYLSRSDAEVSQKQFDQIKGGGKLFQNQIFKEFIWKFVDHDFLKLSKYDDWLCCFCELKHFPIIFLLETIDRDHDQLDMNKLVKNTSVGRMILYSMLMLSLAFTQNDNEIMGILLIDSLFSGQSYDSYLQRALKYLQQYLKKDWEFVRNSYFINDEKVAQLIHYVILVIVKKQNVNLNSSLLKILMTQMIRKSTQISLESYSNRKNYQERDYSQNKSSKDYLQRIEKYYQKFKNAWNCLAGLIIKDFQNDNGVEVVVPIINDQSKLILCCLTKDKINQPGEATSSLYYLNTQQSSKIIVCSFKNRQGMQVDFNIEIIKSSTIKKLFKGKYINDLEEQTQNLNFQFVNLGNMFSQLDAIKQISQEPISYDINQNIKEQRNIEKIHELLGQLRVTMNFIERSDNQDNENFGETILINYMRFLKISTEESIFYYDFKIKNIISLYEAIEKRVEDIEVKKIHFKYQDKLIEQQNIQILRLILQIELPIIEGMMHIVEHKVEIRQAKCIYDRFRQHYQKLLDDKRAQQTKIDRDKIRNNLAVKCSYAKHISSNIKSSYQVYEVYHEFQTAFVYLSQSAKSPEMNLGFYTDQTYQLRLLMTNSCYKKYKFYIQLVFRIIGEEIT